MHRLPESTTRIYGSEEPTTSLMLCGAAGQACSPTGLPATEWRWDTNITPSR